jgi:hypothetical protein
LIPATAPDNGPLLDDVHSFVLRISLDQLPGGQGTARPRFVLEHVNSRTVQRPRDLNATLAALESQVRELLGAGDPQRSA